MVNLHICEQNPKGDLGLNLFVSSSVHTIRMLQLEGDYKNMY